MGIDGKETAAILWKILVFSTNTSIRFMRNHPILSGVSMFLLVLYIFLPSLLFFLIYSSPVLACAVVYARERLGLKFSSLYKPFLSSDQPTSCKGEKRCLKQRSVRRNARMKVEEWDSQTSDEEKDKVILTSLYNDLLGRTPHFEESPKALETNLVEEDNEKTLLGKEEDSRVMDHLNVEEPMVCNCEIKYGNLDGKEEMKEDMSNVNEHGISEVERNKRLESLIARRRARRLFRLALDQRNKLQAEETTSPRQNINNNNLQVSVSRNSLERRRNYSSDANIRGLQIPGSAPSVMLQGRNPFDIPYDPQEERPNLTGDSFDQEFSLFKQKDMFFCRHESFCRFALFSPEHVQCMNSPVTAPDFSSTTSRKHLDLDNEYLDHTKVKLSCNGKEVITENEDKNIESGKSGERDVEMNDETESNKEESDDGSSCSEESESELSRLNNVELREAICQSMDNYPNFLVNQARNNIPSTLPRGLVAPRLDDNNVYYPRRCGGNSHSRTFSVASDMQVEVSEIGSPPTTVDWLDEWSNNGGESYMYDTDIDREIVRDEESRKRISDQYESSSGVRSKEEDNEPETTKPPLAKPEQSCVVDENLITFDDISMLGRQNQTEDMLEQKPSTSSDDVSKPTSSAKFEGLLFHTSASLSSITEEPETIMESTDVGNSENMNGLTEDLTDQLIPLNTLDSSMERLNDVEIADVQQVGNDDLCGSPKIIDHEKKDQVLNSSIQGEHDTEIDMKYENEAVNSLLDASLDTSDVESFERRVEEEKEESNLENFNEGITKQAENEVMELVKNTDEKAKQIEKEDTHNVLEEPSSHSDTELVEGYGNAENSSDVILLQDGNNSLLDELTNLETSKEEEKIELLKDFNDELTQDYKNIAIVEDESVVSADNQNSQDSQTWTQQNGEDSSEGISQQLEHEDVFSSNESASVAKDSGASENNEDENLKPDEKVGEVMEKELELNLESLHHNIGLVTREDDEETKKVIGAMHSEETQPTKDENIILED